MLLVILWLFVYDLLQIQQLEFPRIHNTLQEKEEEEEVVRNKERDSCVIIAIADVACYII
jgi:hypothetical protein